MRKIYLFALSAVLGIASVNAQQFMDDTQLCMDVTAPMAASNVFGYCLDDSSQPVSRNTPADGLEVSFAIYVPEAAAQQLAGNKVESLNIAFNNRYRRDVQIFFRETLDGNDLYATPEMRLSTTGWNEVTLDEPFEITGKAFYVGYSYRFYQSTNTAMAYFDVYTRNQHSCWSKFGDGEWNNTDMHDFGALCLQLVMSGGKTLGTDMGAQSIVLPTSARGNQEFTIEAVARNYGGVTIDSYDLYYNIDGGNDTKVSVSDKSIEPNGTDTTTLVISIPESGIGNHEVAIRVENDGDTNTDNNVASNELIVYTQPVGKKVLLEEFTGMECAWCGEAQNHIDTYLKQSNVQDKTVMVAHHSYKGNNYDYYALETSIQYSGWFYNNAAPQMMINRSADLTGTLCNDVLAYNPGMMVANILSEDCFTSIGIESEYDEATREATITVKGTKYLPLDYDYLTLHVVLTEDGLVNWQNSPSGVLPRYTHNHVARVFVTEPTGDPIKTEAGTYECTYTVTIPETIMPYQDPNGGEFRSETSVNPDNMNVVAFIGNFNIDDPFDCEVINVNTCKLGESVSGIDEVQEGTIADAPDCEVYYYAGQIYVDGTNIGVDIYSLAGTLVKTVDGTVSQIDANGLQDGLYFVKVKTSTDGNAVVKKVLIN